MPVTITEPAQQYLRTLLDGHESNEVSVRIFVNSPGTPRAETCLAYCLPDERQQTDQALEGVSIPVWVDASSMPYLEEAKVDFTADELGGGQLTILAPHARLPQLREDSPISERINYVLQNEINPGLSSHGGYVQLYAYREDEATAVLQFGGGCQGCGMVEATLKDGVEATLKERIPEIAAVRDVTDHSDSTNAYYK